MGKAIGWELVDKQEVFQRILDDDTNGHIFGKVNTDNLNAEIDKVRAASANLMIQDGNAGENRAALARMAVVQPGVVEHYPEALDDGPVLAHLGQRDDEELRTTIATIKKDMGEAAYNTLINTLEPISDLTLLGEDAASEEYLPLMVALGQQSSVEAKQVPHMEIRNPGDAAYNQKAGFDIVAQGHELGHERTPEDVEMDALESNILNNLDDRTEADNKTLLPVLLQCLGTKRHDDLIAPLRDIAPSYFGDKVNTPNQILTALKRCMALANDETKQAVSSHIKRFASGPSGLIGSQKLYSGKRQALQGFAGMAAKRARVQSERNVRRVTLQHARYSFHLSTTDKSFLACFGTTNNQLDYVKVANKYLDTKNNKNGNKPVQAKNETELKKIYTGLCQAFRQLHDDGLIKLDPTKCKLYFDTVVAKAAQVLKLVKIAYKKDEHKHIMNPVQCRRCKNEFERTRNAGADAMGYGYCSKRCLFNDRVHTCLKCGATLQPPSGLTKLERELCSLGEGLQCKCKHGYTNDVFEKNKSVKAMANAEKLGMASQSTCWIDKFFVYFDEYMSNPSSSAASSSKG